MRADGPAVGVDGGERHRGGLGQRRGDRLVEPARELAERIAVDVALVERGAVVLGAKRGGVGDGNGRRVIA